MNPDSKYYKLSPEEICIDVNGVIGEGIQAEVEDIKFLVFPHVYPSHKFRTTAFVLKNLRPLLKGKKICDMGCGPGIVGLFSLKNGASQVVQADINPLAVENAKKNNELNKLNTDKITTYESDCFDNIPKTVFDLIVFNMPYHSEEIKIDDPLKYAFYDPLFKSIQKFLQQAKKYSHEQTEVFIAFSNKGDVLSLETIFEQNSYRWELWKVINQREDYDNRIYRLVRE